MVHEVEAFYGVYCLYNLNPKFKGRVYIGKTTDPNRRIHQHNTGAKAGGAWRTDGKGPWEMVLIIHGFPEAVSALRFEWAWQHPKISRRIRHLPGKRKTEKSYDFHFRIVSEMLNTAPWNRLALTIRWLNQDYQKDFSSHPPVHMPIEYGPIVCKKVGGKKKKKTKGDNTEEITVTEKLPSFCAVCSKMIQKDQVNLTCLYPDCEMASHIICLAQRFLLGSDHLLPVEGNCPRCGEGLMWGELVRQQQGCHQNIAKEKQVTGVSSEYTDDTE